MIIAICAATPFQSLNAINLAMHSLDEDAQKILFYRNYSSTTENILQGILRYSIFDEVYEYDLVKKTYKSVYLLNDLIQAIDPRLFLKWITKKHIDVKEKNFDIITITSGTEFEVALTRIFPDAKTIAYDDGLGSYVGDIVHDHKLKWIWRALGRRTDGINPISLYVNNVEFCESTLSKKKIELTSLNTMNKEDKKLLIDIFGMDDAAFYSNRQLIYLSQPINELGDNLEKIEKKLEECLMKFKNNGIYRKHPRDTHETRLKFAEDQSCCLWELICGEIINDDNVLLSICSSAQIMPKILYDKEPWIIFTYKLYGLEKSNVYKNRFKPIIEMIKQKYRNMNKVVEPGSIKELEEVINYIMKLNKAKGQKNES
mgnify:CR=1 FL=1